jgi:hypothetical protein
MQSIAPPQVVFKAMRIRVAERSGIERSKSPLVARLVIANP